MSVGTLLEEWPKVQSDDFIVQAVQKAFAKRARPEHFANFQHCSECAEHDEVLRSRDVYSLSMADVGNPGWDPICFTSAEGFAYYLPALIRLALAEPTEPYGWYGPQLLFHLASDGVRNERMLACTVQERQAVVGFLRHLIQSRPELVDDYNCADELFRVTDYWSDESKGG